MAVASLSQPPPSGVASDLSTVSPQYKVHVPKECFAVSEWPSQPQPPVPVIAELVGPGRIRLYLADAIQEKLDALQAAIDRGEAADRFERLGVLADRYRKVAFYTKEKTLLLKPVIVVYLGLDMKGERQVFVEARKSIVDIMSLEYRSRRNEALKEGTTVQEVG